MNSCKREHILLKNYKEIVINDVTKYIDSKIGDKIKELKLDTTIYIKHYYIDETRTFLNSINKYFGNNDDESIVVSPSIHESTFIHLLKQHINDTFKIFNDMAQTRNSFGLTDILNKTIHIHTLIDIVPKHNIASAQEFNKTIIITLPRFVRSNIIDIVLSIIESNPITLLPQLLNNENSIITSLYIHKEDIEKLKDIDEIDRVELMKFVKDEAELPNDEEYVVNKELVSSISMQSSISNISVLTTDEEYDVVNEEDYKYLI